MANVTFPNGSGLAQPSMSFEPPEHGCLFLLLFSPSDCLCIYFRSVQFVRCECVRSGSFKHCSKSIALIKGITSQKREKKKNTSCFEEQCEARKSEIYKANVCHFANNNTIERLLELRKKPIIQAKIKERKERYVFTISPALSVYLADDETYFFLGQPILTWPPNPTGWSQWLGLTHILPREMHICVYVHVNRSTVCTVYVHVCVLVYMLAIIRGFWAIIQTDYVHFCM